MYSVVPDISRYQGDVNFSRMARMEPKRVYLKCTDGSAWVDPWYTRNVEKAKAHGLAFGSYHYFQPGQDGKAQAEKFLSTRQASIEPLVVDVEETRGINSQYANRLFDCLVRLEMADGIRPTIYTRASYWKVYLSGAWAWASGYRVWVAHYTDRLGPSVCLPWDPANWYLWQYGTPALGSLYGVATKDIDLSVFNTDGPYHGETPALGLYELGIIHQEPPKVRLALPSPADLYREWKAQRLPNYRKG